MDSTKNATPTNWVEVTEPLAAIQNIINGCLLAQSRGAYSLEDSAALWDSIKYLIALQTKLREENKNINSVFEQELAKPEEPQNIEQDSEQVAEQH